MFSATTLVSVIVGFLWAYVMTDVGIRFSYTMFKVWQTEKKAGSGFLERIGTLIVVEKVWIIAKEYRWDPQDKRKFQKTVIILSFCSYVVDLFNVGWHILKPVFGESVIGCILSNIIVLLILQSCILMRFYPEFGKGSIIVGAYLTIVAPPFQAILFGLHYWDIALGNEEKLMGYMTISGKIEMISQVLNEFLRII